MRASHKGTIINVFALSFLLISCSPSFFNWVSNTPFPTLTFTPQHTPTTTITLTPTSTPTPQPTETNTPPPVCQIDTFSSQDLDDLDMITNGAEGQQHVIEKEDDISVSKLIKDKGLVFLVKEFQVSKAGNYLISVDIRRGEFDEFRIAVYKLSTFDKITDITFKSDTIPETEYATVTSFFEIKEPTRYYTLLGTYPENGIGVIWMKNLRICLTE